MATNLDFLLTSAVLGATLTSIASLVIAVANVANSARIERLKVRYSFATEKLQRLGKLSAELQDIRASATSMIEQAKGETDPRAWASLARTLSHSFGRQSYLFTECSPYLPRFGSKLASGEAIGYVAKEFEDLATIASIALSEGRGLREESKKAVVGLLANCCTSVDKQIYDEIEFVLLASQYLASELDTGRLDPKIRAMAKRAEIRAFDEAALSGSSIGYLFEITGVEKAEVWGRHRDIALLNDPTSKAGQG